MPSCRLVFWTGAMMVALTALVLSSWHSFAAEGRPSSAQVEFFEKRIRPVLDKHCYRCHSAESPKVRGGLRLDTREGLRKGGDRGPAIVPGDPAASPLLKAIRFEDLEMPPGAKLPERVIEDFRTWIKQGAADPRQSPPTITETRKIDIAAGKRFWSFQPPGVHAVPPVCQPDWPQKKIDHFILARLEQAGLAPSRPADRRTWARRVSFDLIGLPPAPEEVEAFVADPAPNAREKMVERLLASPAYGERWARMWLDVARYAEDQAHIVGSNRSLFYPNAYLYRDWVIRALNADLPFDRFVKLQLAADLIEPHEATNWVALGFLGLGPKYYGRKSPAVMADEWEDRVDTVSRGLLSLTVACARCHDHKYDPIPTTDYYALAGVFASTRMFNAPLDDQQKKKTDGEASQPEKALHVVSEGTPTDLPVFIRGDIGSKGPVVRRHFLQVLCDGTPRPFQRGSGRLELAEMIASRHNPLTARVIVNRIWALHFGVPLVGTPSNFGALGERPSHPELLDDLAVRFMESGWSLKWLQREIVLSATYGQSSRIADCGLRMADSKNPAALTSDSLSFNPQSANRNPQSIDSDNRLLGRMNRRRLSVEAWRDAVLCASGRLDRTLGGRSIAPEDPKERRRSVYSAVSRLELNRMLALFDFPDPNAHASRRVETITPLQKLFVLNSPFMLAQAAYLAERLTAEAAADDPHRIDRAYRLLYGRPATERETRLGLEFLAAGVDRPARWQQYAHVLLAANEMMFPD
jgi:hypothetical protein